MPSTRAVTATRDDESCALVINAGSSSLKFALYALSGDSGLLWRGKLEGLGADHASLSEQGAGAAEPIHTKLGRIDPAAALERVLARSEEILAGRKLAAVGHRVVHGGPTLAAPVRVDANVLRELRSMVPYDPAHQANEIRYIEAIVQRWPAIPQVACFDTTFHRHLPNVAQRLPFSRADAARGLRRYGFHGLSYEHLVATLRETSPALANRRLLLAHLGNGASLAAVRDGRCIDTTMGLTPTGGFPMSTRSGDLDPGVLLWLARQHGLTIEALFEEATRKSGLLAISETTSDLRELLEHEPHDLRAAEAVEYFCYHVRKAMGALAAALGGLDVLVFTGGIGEHQPAVRARICGGLAFLGVVLDAARNSAHAPLISPDGARPEVRVIPADEERMIARAVREVMNSRE